MRTINRYILLVISVLLINISYSQQYDKYSKHKEKMEAEKVAFITKKLEFSVKEAQKFWPSYNEFQAEKQKLRKQKKKSMQTLHNNFKTMSESEMEKVLDETINIDLKIEALRVKYNTKFKKAIGVKKTALYYESERDFRRTLLRNIKGHCVK